MRGGHATNVQSFLAARLLPEWLSWGTFTVELLRVKSASTVSSVSDLMEVMTRITGGSALSSTSQ